MKLMNGQAVSLPTCPICCMFIDVALECGMAIEQAALEREEAREKRKEHWATICSPISRRPLDARIAKPYRRHPRSPRGTGAFR